MSTQLQESNDQVRSQIRLLREVPTQMGELGQSVAELRARTDAPQRSWVRAEALYLLELGARRLRLEHDVPTAIAALESADARLATVSDPAVTEVRTQLARELTALRAVDVPDISSVLSRLAAVESAAADFRVLGVPVAKARRLDTTDAEAAEGAFDRATRRLRQAWRDLFSYRRVDPSRSRLVTRRGRVPAPPAARTAAVCGTHRRHAAGPSGLRAGAAVGDWNCSTVRSTGATRL